MPGNSKEYMKEYRARKKAEKEGITEIVPTFVTKEEMESALDLAVADGVISPEIRKNIIVLPETDRERGLPRSNYYSDHKAPGGWTEVIQKIDPKLATKILDKIAPPRKTFR